MCLFAGSDMRLIFGNPLFCLSAELGRLYCPSVVLARTCGAYAVSADGTRQAGADQVCQPGTAGVGGG